MHVNLEPCTGAEIPFSPHSHLKFRSMIGGLAYLSTCTKPDPRFAVSALVRSVHAPFARYLAFEKRVFRYLAGTLEYGRCFAIGRPITAQIIKAAVDADWDGY